MDIRKLLSAASGRITKKESFFSCLLDAHVYLTEMTHTDGSRTGKVVTDEDEVLYFGPKASEFFYNLHAREEMKYALLYASYN